MGLRVYELAKEIGKDSKYILLVCHDLNITTVENHMNVLEDEQEDRIREYMGAPPAVHVPTTEPPKKKRPRPARPRKKTKPKEEEAAIEVAASPESAAAEKMEEPSAVERIAVKLAAMDNLLRVWTWSKAENRKPSFVHLCFSQ